MLPGGVSSPRCSGPSCVVAIRPHTLRQREVECRSSGRPPSTHPASVAHPVVHPIPPLRAFPSKSIACRFPDRSPIDPPHTLPTASHSKLRPAIRRLRVYPAGRLAGLGEIRNSLGFLLHIIETPPAPPDVYPHDAGTPCGPGSAREPRSPVAPSRGKPRSEALPSFVHQDLKEPFDVQV